MQPASSFIVFADESGDHGLTRINPNYPIFVLSCCIFPTMPSCYTVPRSRGKNRPMHSCSIWIDARSSCAISRAPCRRCRLS